MNVTDIREAHANAEYLRLQALEHQRAQEFHAWLASHPQRSAIYEALANLAEVMVLDDLRCKAAGYEPRPWQEALRAYDIIPGSALAPFIRLYQEARH